MKPSFILPVLLFAFLSAANDDDEMECCAKKIVGGKTYMLASKLDKMEAVQYKCASPCLYTMDGDDEEKFCFKPGKQESKCAINSTHATQTTQGTGGSGDSKGL